MIVCLFFSLFATQVFLVSTSVIGKEQKKNKEEPPSFEGNKTVSKSGPEEPSFLLTIYHQIAEANGEAYLVQSVQAEWDQDAGEFYLLPSIVRTPSKRFRKAEIFLSIHEMEANENLMASIYEVRTGVKVSSRHLPSHRSGWLPLPITKMLKQWIPREQVPLRFKIFIKGRGGNESAITDHIQTPKVWLVLYTKVDHEHPFPHLAPDVEMRGPSGDRRRRDITRTKMAESKKACRKEDMIVNSMALSSSVKIIHPKSFNAFQCSGKCSETEKTKFINHSLLKDFVLQKKGIKRNEEPCCFPTKLKPITFIYKTDNGGFVIRAVKDLIVEECGCH